jgi:hypothetical protein
MPAAGEQRGPTNEQDTTTQARIARDVRDLVGGKRFDSGLLPE